MDLYVAWGAHLTTTPEHFGITAKLKMLKSHKVFHTFSTPGQIRLNECCPQIRIAEQSEIINKVKTIEITQGFSYFFQITLNGFCAHWRIHEHFGIIGTLGNANISLHQCNKTDSLKSMHHDKFEPTCPCQ